MKRNVGSLDRIARIGFALVIGILFFTGQITGVAAVILGAMAGIFVLTGAVGYCPLYGVVNRSTHKAVEM